MESIFIEAAQWKSAFMVVAVGARGRGGVEVWAEWGRGGRGGLQVHRPRSRTPTLLLLPGPGLPGRGWGAGAGKRRSGRGGAVRGEAAPASTLSAEATHGSQLPRSVLSRERLLVLRGDAGLGGLLRLELLEAVECLGESESSPSKSLTGASLPWSMPPEDREPSDGEGMGGHLAL